MKPAFLHTLPLWLALILIASPAALAITPIRILEFDKDQLDPSIKPNLKIVDGARWTDANGENFLLITETGTIPARAAGVRPGAKDARIIIQHHTLQNGQWTRGQGVLDGRINHVGALRVSVFGTITITDVDRDGIAESMVAYKTSMSFSDGDRPPEDRIYFKVVMIEGKDRFIANGAQSVPNRGLKAEIQLDKALQAASLTLRAAVTKHWKQYAKEAFERF